MGHSHQICNSYLKEQRKSGCSISVMLVNFGSPFPQVFYCRGNSWPSSVGHLSSSLLLSHQPTSPTSIIGKWISQPMKSLKSLSFSIGNTASRPWWRLPFQCQAHKLRPRRSLLSKPDSVLHCVFLL